ncbi:MAG: helix-turn-helix domain-containing protein [Moraxella sp.]|nr:helix-turn-helix domain-containing protein [Moraxella sp.]
MPNQDLPLHTHVQLAVERYLNTLEGEEPNDVYALFLAQLEKPLLEAILRYTHGNQSRTAKILGVNRGTLRSKLKQHGLL